MVRRQSKLIVVLLSLLLIVSCAKKQLQLKPEEEMNRAYYEHLLAHAQATQKYAEAAMKYNLHVEAADPETKAFFVKEVDPLWVQANDALDTWEVAIKAGGTGQSEIAAYKAIKTKILLKMPDLFWSD